MSETNQELQILLDRAGVIKEKYEIVNKDNEFNIFSILRNEGEEVGLHSRFIYELLNPEGVHYKGDIFLKSFLKLIDNDNDNFHETHLENVKVKREYSHASGRIDLLVCTSNKTFIIENKIYQPVDINQLKDYYKSFHNMSYPGIKVVLLTLSDHEFENDDVLKKLNDSLDGNLIMISYREDIKNWLTGCIKETVQSPLLREALVMYKNLVLKLTGQSYSEGMVREMKDLIIKNRGNFENAVKIANSLSEARREILIKFWGELEDILKNEYGLEAENLEEKANKSTITNYEKYSSKEIGLPYLLKDEEEYKLIFWVEVNKNFGFGYSFCLYDYNKNYISDEEKLPEIWHQVSSIGVNILGGYPEHSGRPAVKWAKENLKFTFDGNNDDFMLVDDSSREKIITEIAKEIHEDINTFIEAFK